VADLFECGRSFFDGEKYERLRTLEPVSAFEEAWSADD
jgi:hypothetical protein